MRTTLRRTLASRFSRSSTAGLLAGTLLLAACSSGGSGGDGAVEGNVFLFTSVDEISDLTAAASFLPSSFFGTLGGPILAFDAESQFFLLFDVDGTPFIFATRDEITAVSGAADVDLGSIDQLLGGALADQIIAADGVSGLLLRFETDGTVHVHATEDQVTDATGESSARIHHARSLLANQIVAQDLESGHILRFDNFGNASVFVDVLDLVDAADLPNTAFALAGLVRGGDTDSQFGWFLSDGGIVRIAVNGSVETWVSHDALVGLLPEVLDLHILSVATESSSDALYILVADGDRGVATVIVNPAGTEMSVFTLPADFEDVLGGTFDIRAFGIIEGPSGSFFYAVDSGTAQLLTFTNGGFPEIVGFREDLETVAGTPDLDLGREAPLFGEGLVVFEGTSENLILVR